MSKGSFSTRIDANTKNKLNAMIEESGLSAKDFMGKMVAAYETQVAREAVGHVKEAEQLHYHLTRVEQIYIGHLRSVLDQEEGTAARIKEAEQLVQETKAALLDAEEKVKQAIAEAQTQIETAQAEAALAREEAKKQIQDMRDALARALESQEQSTRLAAMAEQSAAAAESKAKELAEKAKASDGLRRNLDAAQRENEELTEELEKIRSDLARQLKDAKDTLQQQREEHKVAIQLVADKADLEKREAVLAAREEAGKEIGALREQLSDIKVAFAEHRERSGREISQLEALIAKSKKIGT